MGNIIIPAILLLAVPCLLIIILSIGFSRRQRSSVRLLILCHPSQDLREILTAIEVRNIEVLSIEEAESEGTKEYPLKAVEIEISWKEECWEMLGELVEMPAVTSVQTLRNDRWEL